MTVGEFQELAEMLLTGRYKGSLLLIAARRGAVVPAVWRVAASVAKGRYRVISSEIFTATLPGIIGMPESVHCIWRAFIGEGGGRRTRSG